jgi:hypothetical protein
MMWNNLVPPPARGFQRAYWKKWEVQMPSSYPSMVANHLRSDLYTYFLLLQLTGNVYNLLIDMVVRRASSHQQCNP